VVEAPIAITRNGRRKTYKVDNKFVALLDSDKHYEGLHRLRDSLFAELRDLNKSKPRGKADENLVAEINRLESTLLITKDDLACRVLCC
jgi:hypothetical protein